MNLLHLKALLLAAETGSISAAARKLGKKQPQVSQWISDLEIDLGVSFFDRTGNKMSLSKDGERLLPYLSHSMSQLTKLVQSADIIAQGESTVMRIGIENYIPDLAFAVPLALTLELSHLCIEVYREERHQLMQDLTEGDADIIIVHESDTLHHQNFEYCRLGHYKEVLACSSEHPLSKLPTVASSDLSQYRELIWGEADSGEKLSNQNDDSFSPSYSLFSDIQLLIAVLQRNTGFAFLPVESVESYIKNGQLIALTSDFEPTGIDRRIELCWRNGLTLSQYGNQIVEVFKTSHQLQSKPTA
ncbi:transcriptional regulator [Vibrio harveyi]|uniref:LysR family transcriptional regulator n=1 Tax=Vibrio harveyi TaxID=669 RepID=UPI00084203BD|nr:LysR family transcriptional regulator [Vibrio harveyi]ODM57953.1 transcriptional regulator [Vibrio harveyi]